MSTRLTIKDGETFKEIPFIFLMLFIIENLATKSMHFLAKESTKLSDSSPRPGVDLQVVLL